jgi:putative tricarboxylic transport membrane protein
MHGNQDNSKAGLWIGLALLIVAIVIAWNTSQMRIPPTYAKVGPQIFPYLAALALAATGGFFIFQTFGTTGRERVAPDTDETDWRALVAISLGFLFEIVFINPLGFILSASVLFVAVAYGFGSRRYVRDIITALILSSLAYFVFTRLLNLQLPAGIMKGIF